MRVFTTSRRVVSVALGLAFVLVAGACGSGSSTTTGSQEVTDRKTSVTFAPPDGEPQSGGKIVYGLVSETDGWHPGTSRWAPSGVEVSKAFFDTLTAYDENLETHPFLAESLEPNEDFTEWTITMRPDVTFHDGTPANAEALKTNIDWHRSSSLTSVPYQLVDDTIVVDDLTLRIPLSEPWVTLPNALATQIGVLAAPSMLDDPDGTRNPVGTGPFVFDSWTPDAQLVVKKNPDYWQEGYPYLDEIEFRPIPDPVARKAALQSGEVDILEVSNAQNIIDITHLSEEGEFQIFLDETGEVRENLVMLNTAVPPFDDLVARQALAYATDQQNYIDTIADGLYEPATSPYQQDSRWHTDDLEYPEYDLARAIELSRQYEAEHGEPIRFTLLGTTAERDERSLLKEMWAAAGIEADLADTETGQLVLDVISGDYQATMWTYFDAPNPVADSIWWLCDAAKPPGELALNFSRNCNEDMDAEFQQARQTPDLDEQKEHYDEVQRLMNEDLPFIWLYHLQTAVATREGVWDVTTWQLPDGTPGLPLQSGSHPLFQIWVSSD